MLLATAGLAENSERKADADPTPEMFAAMTQVADELYRLGYEKNKNYPTLESIRDRRETCVNMADIIRNVGGARGECDVDPIYTESYRKIISGESGNVVIEVN